MRMQNSYDIAQARKREHEIKVEPFKGARRATPSAFPDLSVAKEHR